MLGKKRGCRIDKGRKNGRSSYIPMHQPGFKEHFSYLMQKRTASNQSPTPLKPVLGSSLEFLGFPGSHKGLGEYLATPLQPARPSTEPLKLTRHVVQTETLLTGKQDEQITRNLLLSL